jgi:hypothetical protein
LREFEFADYSALLDFANDEQINCYLSFGSEDSLQVKCSR